MNCLISIVVPVYNAQYTIKRCIDSVQKQTYSNWELVLVDDGSTDNSLEICNRCAAGYSNIKIISQKNQGVSAARNTGIDNASGDYILMLDGDDELEADMLEVYSSVAQNSKADMLIGGLQKLEYNKPLELITPETDGDIMNSIWNFAAVHTGVFGMSGGKMFRRQFIMEHQLLYDVQMISQEDLDFAIRVAKSGAKVNTMTYAGYRYYYAESARRPQYADYIKNQMHIRQYAEIHREVLSEKAFEMTTQRIITNVYGALYSAESKLAIEEVSEKVLSHQGLGIILRKAYGTLEQRIIFRLFLDKRYSIIYNYFRIRNYIRKVLRKN